MPDYQLLWFCISVMGLSLWALWRVAGEDFYDVLDDAESND